MDTQTRVANHVNVFCQEHGISRATFYNLLKRGHGPVIMKVGRRTLISAEAAAEMAASNGSNGQCDAHTRRTSLMTQQLEIVPETLLDSAPGRGRRGSSIPSSNDDVPAGRPTDKHSMADLGDDAELRVKSLRPDQIRVGHRVRALNPERLEGLMNSISTIGLRSPITVRVVSRMAVDGVEGEDVPVLVAGFHRLEAVKKLGIEWIDCLVERGTELDGELWEIDENLCRAELTALERAEHLERRKALYERINPEARRGGLPGAAGGGKAKTANLAGFASDTAAKTGISERTIRRDTRRATRLDAGVRSRIGNNRDIANSGTELDTLAGMSAPERNRAIDMVEAGQVSSVREAKKLLEEPIAAEVSPHRTPEPEETRASDGRQNVRLDAHTQLGAGASKDTQPRLATLESSIRAYPDVDPFNERDPEWINGALTLIPLLAEALPLDEELSNRDAIIHGALAVIPRAHRGSAWPAGHPKSAEDRAAADILRLQPLCSSRVAAL